MVALSFANQPGAWLGIEPLNLGHCLAMCSLTTKVATTNSSSSDDEFSESQFICTLQAKHQTTCGHGGRNWPMKSPGPLPVQVADLLMWRRSWSKDTRLREMPATTEARPLRIGLGVCCRAESHQVLVDGSPSGGLQGTLSQLRISYHTCRENGQARRRCRRVSGAWSQSGQHAGCCKPRRARRSAVQHRSKWASQWKKRTRGGAQHFQVSFQASHAVDPWNVAR